MLYTHILIEQATSCLLWAASMVAPQVLLKAPLYVYEGPYSESFRLHLVLQQTPLYTAQSLWNVPSCRYVGFHLRVSLMIVHLVCIYS